MLMSDVISDVCSSDLAEPSLKFLHDLFELRMIVEPSAAELAAERRTEDQVQAMRSALDAMARHGLATDAGRLADQQFHMIMLEASRNDAVIALASSIMEIGRAHV